MSVSRSEHIACASSLVELLEANVRSHPDHEIATFMTLDGSGDTFSRHHLSLKARALASALQQTCKPGDRALLLFPSGADYVIGLLGCLYAGVIAVPVNLPGSARVSRVLPKVLPIAKDCQPGFLLTTGHIAQDSAEALDQLCRTVGCKVLVTDAGFPDPESWAYPDVSPATVAFLQYTSGSTGDPKGVVNTHAGLLLNSAFIGRANGLQKHDSVTATWLPLFHDMGLIMGVLAPLLHGARSVVMPPAMFTRDPLTWLETATRFSATVLPGPAFGFRACLDALTPERLSALNLSRVEVAVPAAEPVDPLMLNAFIEAFAPAGLRREAVRPGYGLAEATLMVSGCTTQDGPVTRWFDVEALEQNRVVSGTPQGKGSRAYVSCGSDFDGQDIQIVDPETRMPVTEDRVGEIWVSGPSVAAGYWNKSDPDGEVFGAVLNVREDHPLAGNRYLRTGDLGILYEGRLYITGRLKDVMIFHGRCHYPNDIEKTVSDFDPRLVPGGGAAFSIQTESGEALVVVQEALRKGDLPALMEQVRQDIGRQHGIPVHAITFIRKGTLLRTTSGKVRRKAVRQAWLDGNLVSLHSRLFADTAPEGTGGVSLRQMVQQLVARALGGVDPRTLDPQVGFFDLGLDSVTALDVIGRLEKTLGLRLPDTLLFSNPNMDALVAWLEGRRDTQPDPDPVRPLLLPAGSAEPIAVIGIGLVMPTGTGKNSESPDEFLTFLLNGGDAVRSVPQGRYDVDLPIPGYGAFLGNVDGFDAAFFGISPREAISIDPQHRHLLEVSWHALEDAGLDPGSLKGSDTGVFVGISGSEYAHLPFLSGDADPFDVHYAPGISTAAAAGRLSYVLGFEGPALSLDTACSASMVAVHLACQGLRAGECSLALAAGAKVQILPEIDLALHKAGMLAPDGRCKTFDKDADGYVRGEGCAVLVLKPLSHALADGNRVRAVIRQSVVRQDGTRAGLTVPDGHAQEAMIRKVLRRSGLSPDAIDYVELHGTGTRLGDPIEFNALSRIFGADGNRSAPLLMGSVKTNIGHLEAAAGIAGLVKTILALESGVLPPHGNLQTINPAIALQDIPARLPAQPEPWPERTGEAPRRALVSSFGFTGAIACAVLESAPAWHDGATSASDPDRPAWMLALSASSPNALEVLSHQYAERVANTGIPLAPLLNGAHRCRSHLPIRRAVVGRNRDELVQALSRIRGQFRRSLTAPRIAFVFSGQSTQYPGMTRGLYAFEPRFRSALDEVSAVLEPCLGFPVTELLFAESDTRLGQTQYDQPALFAVGYALARMWIDLGVQPDFIIGHSVGEFQAAVIAGILPLHQAAHLVVERGRLMQALPAGGAMAALRMKLDEATDLLLQADSPTLAIAAINGPEDIVIGGDDKALQFFLTPLKERGLSVRMLDVSHAFHTPLMDPVLEHLEQAASGLQAAEPRIPMWSTVDRSYVDPERMGSGAYWRDHARNPVSFVPAVQAAIAHGCSVFLEIGPAAVLTPLIRRTLVSMALEEMPVSLSSLRRDACDAVTILDTLAKLYEAGVNPDWSVISRGPVLPPQHLPLYPFERRTYWMSARRVYQGVSTEEHRIDVCEASAACAGSDTAYRLTPVAASEQDLAAALVSMEPEQYASGMLDLVTHLLSRILRIEPQRLLPGQDLLSMGLDSILAMEFVRSVNQLLAISCALRPVFETPTTDAISHYLCTLMTQAREIPREHDADLIPDASNRYQPFPLTELQYAYWAGRSQAFAMGNIACHAYLETESVTLDPRCLEDAWNVLIQRHDALRLVIDADGRQHILPDVPLYHVPVVDMSGADVASAEAHVQAWRDEMEHQVLPTERWPLFDVRVTRMPGGKIRLHLSIDMLIIDATSSQIVWDELEALCRHGANPDHAGLLPLSLSFRDYVLARQHRQDFLAERDAARVWWTNRLDALPPAPDLPLAVDPATITNPVFVRHSARLEAGLWSAIKDQAALSGITPAALLVSAFADALAAWSASSRFTLNLTIFDRRLWHPDVPRLVGDFTSVVLLGVDRDGRAAFIDNARTLFADMMEALEHRAFSAVDVLRDMARSRDQRKMLMPVVFTSQLGTIPPSQSNRADSVLGNLVRAVTQTPQVWIDQQVSEAADGSLVINWDMVEALFPEGMPQAMFEAYCTLLERLGQDRTTWLHPVGPLLPHEQRQVRAVVNNTHASIPEGLLHEPFFRKARENSDQTALVGGDDTTWSYGDLAAWSVRIAHAVRGTLAQPAHGQRVAVLMEKGPEQVAAVLGVLAAGHTYVPIDPAWPDLRVSGILDSADITVLLVQSWRHAEITARFGEGRKRHVLDVSEAALFRYPDTVPEPAAIHPEDAAYIIYTSGSTGVPKGVVIDHRGPLNTVIDVNSRFGVTCKDRVFGLSSLSFDLSVYDIFGTFACGATLVLPHEDDRRDPVRWSRLCRQYGVTVWNSVPALLDMLLTEADPVAVGGLRVVMLSGDWVPLSLPERLRTFSPHVRLVCMGGATEASIWSNWFLVDRVEPHWRSVPYGYPLSNQGYRVLDSGLNDRPDWVPGDLYITGIGLAKEYAGDPEKTAASFPCHPDDGMRLYRTGDMARYWPDGVIEFLGRKDHQVKIAGHRIETGEIEAALLSHPAVRDAVVDALGHDGEIKRLVAWFTVDPAHMDAAPCFLPDLSRDPDTVQEEYGQVVSGLHAVAGCPIPGQTPAAYEALWALMSKVARQCVRDTLLAAGLFVEPGSCLARDDVFRILRCDDRFTSVATGWLAMLLETGELVAHDDNLLTPSGLQNHVWDDLANEARRVGFPAGILASLKQGSGMRLFVVRGEEDPLALFYGADDVLSPEYLARLDPLYERGLAAVHAVLADRAGQATLEQPLRVLEIGARGGLASREILEGLGNTLHYTVTDTSRLFLDRARQVLDAVDGPAIDFSLLDPDQDPVFQGFPLHGFDVVIACNALHRSRNIPRLLGFLSRLLVPGGLVLAPEITRSSPLQGVTVALLEEGYRHLEDQRQQAGQPLLDPNGWEGMFSAAGWPVVRAVPLLTHADMHPGVHVLAACSPTSAHGFTVNVLQDYLSARVPVYMMPSAFLLLDSVPLSSNGKVDRQALPKPVGTGMRRRSSSLVTATEQKLAVLWREVLGVDGLGREDSFFDLGGDSLTAVRLVERVRSELDKDIRVRDVFDAPVLAAFATRLDVVESCEEEALPALVPAPQDRFRPFALTDVQEAYWIGRQISGISTWLYLEIDVDDVDPAQLAVAWNRLVHCHDMLRAVVDENGQQRVLETVPDYAMPIIDGRMLSLPACEQHTLAWRQDMSHQVRPTEQWPLFDIRIIRTAESQVRIFFGIDNIICDGRSIQMLLRMWLSLARMDDPLTTPLSVPGLSFRDYLCAVEGIQGTGRWRRSLAWWLQRMEHLPPAPDLPLAMDPDCIEKPTFERREGRLSPEQWVALRAHAVAAGVTPNAVLLSAYGLTLGAFSSRRDLTLNLTLFNRLPLHPDVDHLIGDFTSLVLLAIGPDPQQTFVDTVRAVQARLWDDIGHMQVSAVRVLRDFARHHGLEQAPTFPVVFTSGLGAGSSTGEDNLPGRFGFGITQTPQTWLDHQVLEKDGGLFFNWDSVQGLFPEGLLDEAFEAYSRFLESLVDAAPWQSPSRGYVPENSFDRFRRMSVKRMPQYHVGASAPADKDRADVEKELSALVQSVGNLVSAPPRDRTFFEIGLSSLTLVRLHQAIRRTMGLECRVVDLFRYPTLSALAAHLLTLRSASQGDTGSTRSGILAAVAQGDASLRRARRRDLKAKVHSSMEPAQ
ncbi:amino acid adenylation domain-containing protein [Haematospirillum sp. H1815]|uniref:non-ribosomal peptide synthetase/type I polyketide synthase n=1 Tax=Haematospirillum sp. H1815 TaxID=2723108 RepID=UPI00143B9F77|nr:non-ribosomal peptide synthetase/type I polyketide synthase [Haematospirillum sp. H1815]NKD77349.1 amino acid adenylation domain-containing protein [Haematospirillum sp. H1815]